MNEKAKLDIPGPAYIVVPISEDLATRFLFNDIVDRVLKHNVKTLEELEQVERVMGDFFTMLEHYPDLAGEMLPLPSAETRDVFRAFHNKVFDQMPTLTKGEST